jgi:glucokinase
VDGTNLPWKVRAAEISSALGGAPVKLLNDLEAAAYSLEDLAPEELAGVQAGEAVPDASLALLSPGTGLGESIVLRRGGRTYPVGSEGGHADFAPRTDEEIDLLRHLRDRWGRVSVERVVSGPGLVNVFCWLRDTGRVRDDSGLEAAPGDSAPAARISAAALAGSAEICREALRVWVGAMASEAGNLVLRGFALGGLFLGGGIPPQILPALRGETFRAAFRNKEPHAAALARVPVHVVLATELTLRGALRAAAEAAREG